MQRTEQPFLYEDVQTGQPVVQLQVRERPPKREAELSTRRIVLHISLFCVSAVMTTLTGAAWSMNFKTSGDGVVDALVGPAISAVKAAAAGNFGPLSAGVVFTFSLLLILGAHEFGHYFACRHYKIRATLPFFIPGPPAPLTPFGTFGAVIKIKEPITSRRALFDIGIAGPLAGFFFAIPASFLGLIFGTAAAPEAAAKDGMVFNDPLMFKLIMKAFHVPSMIDWNPVYWAAWAALLITALNLFPVGQLDGGHVVYAVFGARLHKWISRITCAAIAVLAIVSIVFYKSPIWLLWTFVLLFLLRVGHPPTHTNEPLGRARIAIAIAAVVVFVLCFLPIPIGVMSGQ
ncbi:MAG TPA: site-2 protease family protein [Blastocatellia bacterium]|nr:site-2 protease family protein [Blastocatellia bacterium]